MTDELDLGVLERLRAEVRAAILGVLSDHNSAIAGRHVELDEVDEALASEIVEAVFTLPRLASSLTAAARELDGFWVNPAPRAWRFTVSLDMTDLPSREKGERAIAHVEALIHEAPDNVGPFPHSETVLALARLGLAVAKILKDKAQ